jgi:hypothetical protein
VELYQLFNDGRLEARQRAGTAPTPMVRMGRSVRPLVNGHAVYFAPAAAPMTIEYWSAEAGGGWVPIPGVGAETDGAWSRAAALAVDSQAWAENPGGGAVTRRALVEASRAAGVLTRETSFIAVENEAQWRILALSERRKLGQNAALAFQEAPSPSAWIVGGLFLLLAGVHRRLRELALRWARDAVPCRRRAAALCLRRFGSTR